jgi:hypothetical protein
MGAALYDMVACTMGFVHYASCRGTEQQCLNIFDEKPYNLFEKTDVLENSISSHLWQATLLEDVILPVSVVDQPW